MIGSAESAARGKADGQKPSERWRVVWTRRPDRTSVLPWFVPLS